MGDMNDITLNDIKVQYDGGFPCLCMGHLVVTIKNRVYDFGGFALISGGSCGFTTNYSEPYIEKGDWSVSENDWPVDLPMALRPMVLKKINMEIPHGCCGGCL